jgi:hypothetical protein
MDLVSEGVTDLPNDTGLPSLRLALLSRSMLRPVELLHEVVDDCIGSEGTPEVGDASSVVMPI